MKKKFLFLTMLVAGISVCSPVFAGELNEGGVVTSSWATSFDGESDDSKLTNGYEERLIGEHALGEFDAKGINNSEGTFTGIGYFTNGITFSFYSHLTRM